MAKISKNRIKSFVKQISKQMSKGIEAGIEFEADQLRDKYNQAQSPPESVAGEYPHRDSGQLIDNIAAHMSASSKYPVGGVGVYGRSTPKSFRGNRITPENIGGLHAYFLSHGNPAGNPYVENGVRKGIDDSFMEDRNQISEEIEKGALG